MTSFIIDKKIPSGIVQGIGAVKNIEIGYFDTGQKEYQKSSFSQTLEVISLNGNISYLEDTPFVHLHVAVADEKHMLFGGHLFSGEVAVTLEIYIKVLDSRLERKPDTEFGFNFWHL